MQPLNIVLAIISLTPAARRVIEGPAQMFGAGTARTYVAIDRDGRPTSIGVALSETALVGLPDSGVMINLAMPAGVTGTRFDHVMLNWNPRGHPPFETYGLPHIDFHFYTITLGEQSAISPADSQFAAKLAKRPADVYVPSQYIQRPGGVPMMGSHWVNPMSSELIQGPGYHPFTRTFMYGSYDGHIIFYEPMITLAAILAARTQSPDSATVGVPVPDQYEIPGAYPTAYTLMYDESAHVYRIALDRLR